MVMILHIVNSLISTLELRAKLGFEASTDIMKIFYILTGSEKSPKSIVVVLLRLMKLTSDS
jgi:hypothetical protein